MFLVDKTTKIKQLNARARHGHRYILFMCLSYYVHQTTRAVHYVSKIICNLERPPAGAYMYTAPWWRGWRLMTPTCRIYCLVVVSHPAKFVELKQTGHLQCAQAEGQKCAQRIQHRTPEQVWRIGADGRRWRWVGKTPERQLTRQRSRLLAKDGEQRRREWITYFSTFFVTYLHTYRNAWLYNSFSLQ